MQIIILSDLTCRFFTKRNKETEKKCSKAGGQPSGRLSPYPALERLGSLRSYYGDAEDNVDQKMNIYFTYQSRDTLNSFCLFITVKAIKKLNLGHSNKFEIEFQKISRRSSRSPHNAEFGHFMLLFCRGRQRNVQRVITHVDSYCSAH